MTKTTFSGWCPASGIVVGGLGLLCAKYHHSDPSHITTSGRQKFPRAASTAAEESERGPQNHEGPTETRQGYNADGKENLREKYQAEGGPMEKTTRMKNVSKSPAHNIMEAPMAERLGKVRLTSMESSSPCWEKAPVDRETIPWEVTSGCCNFNVE